MTTLKPFRAPALLLAVLLCGAQALAQTPSLRLPRPSQKASVMQTIGVTDVTITYSRPGVKGRTIWGEASPEFASSVSGTATLDDQYKRPKDAPIVPYGHVWRTGANEATTFTITDDVLVNGQKLAAGTYSLHTIPGKDEWTIIFNSDAGQWGSFAYDEKKDVLRVKAKPQWVSDSQEWLAYTIPEVGPDSARVVVRWEKVAVPFTVQVPDVMAVAVRKAEADIAANPTVWRMPLQLANFYANNKRPEDAMKWVEQSIKVKETFQNLSTKAQLLFAAGKQPEALSTAERALERGRADKVDTKAFEQRLADWKAGKK